MNEFAAAAHTALHIGHSQFRVMRRFYARE